MPPSSPVQSTGMTPSRTASPVNYAEAARRHQWDAKVLEAAGRSANAGQLLGFAMECGLKALLIAAGVPTMADGSVERDKKGASQGRFYAHMPKLDGQITLFGSLIPDGRTATTYLASVPSRTSFSTWSIDHRYWSDAAATAAADLPGWTKAVDEMAKMLDQVVLDGVLAWPY